MYRIYKIYNDINDKVYIGQTSYTINKRFREHINRANGRKHNHRPLYSAMNKYGTDKFHIVELESGLTKDEANTQEKYWIAQYNSFYGDGYNATVGGDDGATHSITVVQVDMNTLKIVNTFSSSHDAARAFGKVNNAPINRVCNHKADSMYGFFWCFADKYEEELVRFKNILDKKDNKVVHIVDQFDMDGNFIRSFKSVYDAEKEMGVKNGHIKRVCTGERKSLHGFVFKYHVA